MLTNRIIGAFTFRKGVYAEVERDQSFTQTAWLIVAVIALLNALGGAAGLLSARGLFSWLIASVITTAFAVGGFALACLVISWVGKNLFSADVDFNEMVRVLGLAYVWNAIGFIAILSIISSALLCILAPIRFLAAIMGFIAWLIAAKEALDLEWGQTIVTLIIGWVVNFIIVLLAGVLLGIFGLAAAGIGGAFGG